MKHILRLLTVWALVLTTAHGVEVACIFSQGMLLQQGMPVPVWGAGKPGENVTLLFNCQLEFGQTLGWTMELLKK